FLLRAILLVALVPLLACAWLWYGDLQRSGAAAAGPRVLLGLGAALLILLPLALAASRRLAARLRHASAGFAAASLDAAGRGGDGPALPLAELAPLRALAEELIR